MDQLQFRLFNPEKSISTTLCATDRWDAIREANEVLRDSTLFFGSTEAWLCDVERNCLVCRFHREGTSDTWVDYPM